MSISDSHAPTLPIAPTVLRAADLSSEPPPESVPILRGVRFLPTPGLDPWGQMREATLARIIAIHRTCPSVEAFSHESAALLHGADTDQAEPDIHTICGAKASRTSAPLPCLDYGDPRRRARQGRAGPCHEVYHRRHRLALPPNEKTMALGIPVTTIPRTIADCLLDLAGQSALVVCDSLLRIAAQADRFHRERSEHAAARVLAEVEPIIRRAGGRRRRRRALRMLPLLNPLVESPPESRLRFELLRMGTPLPMVQMHFIAGGRHYYADLGWPWVWLGWEYDGQGKYAHPDAVLNEKRRSERAEDVGIKLLRAGSADLRAPEALLARTLRHLPASTEPGSFPITPRPWMA